MRDGAIETHGLVRGLALAIGRVPAVIRSRGRASIRFRRAGRRRNAGRVIEHGKRVFLAILLSFVVLAGYQAFFAPPPAPPPVVTLRRKRLPASPAPVESTKPAPMPATADPARRRRWRATSFAETDVLHIVFPTSGATVKSWQLKRYLDYGEALDLVPQDVPDLFPRPFTMTTNDPELSKTLATALFKPSADKLTLGSAPGTLTFEYRDASGLTASKRFYFQQEGKPYVVKVEAAVDVAGASRPVTLLSGAALGLGYTPDGSRTVPARAVRSATAASAPGDERLRQSRYEGEINSPASRTRAPQRLAAGLKIDRYTPIASVKTIRKAGRGRSWHADLGAGPLSLQFFLGPGL